MKLKEILTEGTNLYCPDCGEDFGKDTENAKKVNCSNCGRKNIDNPAGDDDDGEED